MSAKPGTLTRWLSGAHPAVFALYGGVMAFGAYFAMYAFRKPFTAASFADVAGVIVDYKVALVIAQVFGYALSKLAGIRVVSELPAAYRAAAIVGLIAVAELALVGFALTPAPWNIGFLFLNGLPLGMIWGLVFGFLEGRKTSEVLGSILCASFIVSSGVVKSAGKWMMAQGFADEFWMPAVTGLAFTPLLLICVWGLAQLPPPSPEDEALRVRRAPMDKASRAALFKRYAPGLLALIAVYVGLTALRDFRDNFAAEIWTGLGYGDSAPIFSLSEIPVAVFVLLAMALLAVFRDNRQALTANLVLVAAGLLLAGGASAAFLLGVLPPLWWMIVLGAGIYLAYTPFNGLLFDRFIACTGSVGTAGFLIYVADASGYAGSVALLLLKNLSDLSLDWVGFLAAVSIVTALIGMGIMIFALRYFRTAFVKR